MVFTQFAAIAFQNLDALVERLPVDLTISERVLPQTHSTYQLLNHSNFAEATRFTDGHANGGCSEFDYCNGKGNRGAAGFCWRI